MTLNISSDLIRNSNDKTNFPHKLLLTDTQGSKICKASGNGSSANVKFSKTQWSKFIFGPPNILGPPILPKITSSMTKPLINSI